MCVYKCTHRVRVWEYVGVRWGCRLERCRHPFSIWSELYCQWPKRAWHQQMQSHTHTHACSALISYYILCSSVISRAPGLKLVVETLMSSLKPIGNIVVICCAFFIIFGILGVQVRGEGEEKEESDISLKVWPIEVVHAWNRNTVFLYFLHHMPEHSWTLMCWSQFRFHD